jgi:RecB family exonuclease
MRRGIFEYILRALPERRVHFVFPSAVTSDFWARRVAEISLEPVAPHRFIAWDTFKARTLSVSLAGREPVNRALRILFAARLLEENARKETAFLTDYLNPLYAASYNPFISGLAALLPALPPVLRRAAGIPQDPYFLDLRRIYERYQDFLDRHALYEPAWNRAAFAPSREAWILFFPELSEDWEEYEEELTAQAAESPAAVTIIPLDALAPPAYYGDASALGNILGDLKGRWIPFSFAGEEYRWLALTIRRLLAEGGLAPEDVAVSMPEGADTDRLIQELRRYDLPVNRRQGRALAEYPGGRIFAALAACPSSRWSFKALKNLLLDKAFPWKETETITALLDFGLRYRCVSGFMDSLPSGGQREIDVWERTFERRLRPCYERLKQALSSLGKIGKIGDIGNAAEIREVEKEIEERLQKKAESPRREGAERGEYGAAIGRAEKYVAALLSRAAPEEREPLKQALAALRELGAGTFYEGLKKDSTALANAPSFTALERNWHAFEARHFDRTRVHPETDKIIARAINALSDLARIESRFPELAGAAGRRAFPVFQSYLQEERYVFQSKTPGIGVYDYRVAAGIGPAVHFIVTMTQEGASVVYSGGASFLREDRKRALGIADTDRSAEFLRAYRISGAFPVFTLSCRTFSGPAVPHRALSALFGGPAPAPAFPPDPYPAEASLASGKTIPRVAPSSVQVRAWEALQVLRRGPAPLDIRKEPVPAGKLRADLARRLGSRKQTRRDADGAPDIKERAHEEGVVRISPTDLNEYRNCPFKWVLESALHLEEMRTEIETVDQKEMGILYHRILERFFKRIRRESGRFQAERIDSYRTYLAEETRSALEEARRREGAFQESVYAMLEPRIVAALQEYLAGDLPVLQGAAILGAEYPLQKACDPRGLLLSGITDLALSDPEGGLILTDFKTSLMPPKKELFSEHGDPPRDLQMAAYIAMIEDADRAPAEKAGTVRTARFYSIDTRRYRKVVSEKEETGAGTLLRSSYEAEVAAASLTARRVRDAMENGAYMVPRGPDIPPCGNCAVSSVCRMPFSAASGCFKQLPDTRL